ncbi:MAG: hypothetical protein ACHQ4H_04645 [Ktedonobacterales bacterium]
MAATGIEPGTPRLAGLEETERGTPQPLWEAVAAQPLVGEVVVAVAQRAGHPAREAHLGLR